MKDDTYGTERNAWLRMLYKRNSRLYEAHGEHIIQALTKARVQESTERSRAHFKSITEILDGFGSKQETITDLKPSWSLNGEIVEITHRKKTEYNAEEKNFIQLIKNLLYVLSPWRKGPFSIFDTYIDSEWKSYLKWERLSNIFDIDLLCENKIILDIGCSNAYYSFLMLHHKAHMVLGIDPMPRNIFFVELYRSLLTLPLYFELWSLQDSVVLKECFDTVFCMGVLYHQRNPLSSLESIKSCLKKKGMLVLESICLKEQESFCLFPEDRYLKSRGYWFIPSVKVLTSWLVKSGFEILAIDTPTKTTLAEQRHTEWIRGESLESFLDNTNSELTVEGHPAPYRVCLVARKKT